MLRGFILCGELDGLLQTVNLQIKVTHGAWNAKTKFIETDN